MLTTTLAAVATMTTYAGAIVLLCLHALFEGEKTGKHKVLNAVQSVFSSLSNL